MHSPSYLILYDTLDCPVRDTHLISFSCSSRILLYLFCFPRLSLSVSVFLPSSFIDMDTIDPFLEIVHCLENPIASINYPFLVKKIFLPLIDLLLLVCYWFSHHSPLPIIFVIFHLICHVLFSFYSYHLCVLWQDIATVCGP